MNNRHTQVYMTRSLDSDYFSSTVCQWSFLNFSHSLNFFNQMPRTTLVKKTTRNYKKKAITRQVARKNMHVWWIFSFFLMLLPTNNIRNDDEGWVATQLNTTLDVDCYRWMDWFHGGLQFQVPNCNQWDCSHGIVAFVDLVDCRWLPCSAWASGEDNVAWRKAIDDRRCTSYVVMTRDYAYIYIYIITVWKNNTVVHCETNPLLTARRNVEGRQYKLSLSTKAALHLFLRCRSRLILPGYLVLYSFSSGTPPSLPQVAEIQPAVGAG